MAYIVERVVICAAVQLLLVAHSSASPLPARDSRSSDSDSGCDRWQLKTTSENDSVTQVSNGITVFNLVTAYSYQGLINYNQLVCYACTSEGIPLTILLS